MSFFFNKYYRPRTEAEGLAGKPTGRSREIVAEIQRRANAAEMRPAGKRSYSPKVRDDVEFVPDTSRSVAEARVNNSVRRFQSMKHDHNWYTYNDIPRPYNPSDLTGWQTVYRG